MLPAEAPYDLNEESFEALTGKWAPVRTKVSSLVEKLHSDKSLDVVGQRRVIEELKEQIRLIRGGIQQVLCAIGGCRDQSLSIGILTEKSLTAQLD